MLPHRKKPTAVESAHQKALIEWAHMVSMPDAPDLQPFSTLADYLYAIPNGGRRDARTGAMLKAEGVKAGVSDLHLPVARHGWHGLYIEMKAPHKAKGATDSQIEWIQRMQRAGYGAAICPGWLDARAIICWYLGIGRVPKFDDIKHLFDVKAKQKTVTKQPKSA